MRPRRADQRDRAAALPPFPDIGAVAYIIFDEAPSRVRHSGPIAGSEYSARRGARVGMAAASRERRDRDHSGHRCGGKALGSLCEPDHPPCVSLSRCSRTLAALAGATVDHGQRIGQGRQSAVGRADGAGVRLLSNRLDSGDQETMSEYDSIASKVA